MTAYKKQTRDVWFKGRQVFDPSKRMFEEARDASQKDQDFLRDYEARGKDYSKALDNWNRNQALLDKEKVDFFKSISKTIDTSVKSLVVDGMFLRDQAGIQAADRDWAAKPFEEKQKITQEVNEIIKKQSDINWERTSIAAELRKKGLNSYADFIDGQNSAYKTRIHLNILREGLNNLPANLRTALGASGPDARVYTIIHPTTGESIEFTAAEVNNDPTLAGLKIQAIADAVTQDHYWTINPQGIRNDIVTSLIGDKVNDIKNKFIQEQALIQKNNLLSQNLTEMSSEIGAELNLFATWDGDAFSLEPGKADVIQNNIQNFLSTATAHYSGMGEANASEKARELLKNSLVEYVQAQGGSQAQAAELVEDILFGRGDVKILFKHHGTGQNVTLAELDPFRFGLGGSWKEQLVNPTDGSFIQGTLDIDQTDLLSDKGWIPSGVDAKGKKVDYGKLYNKDGTINEQWRGTIQYDWAVRKEAGEKIPDKEIADVLKQFVNYGITDQDALNALRTFDGDGLTAKETKAVLNKIGKSEIVVDGQLVITEDLDAQFNKKAIIEWAKENNVEIVDQYYGAEDTTVLAGSNADILAAVTGEGGLNGSTQAVVNSLEAQVRESVKQHQANNPTPDSVNYKTEAELIPIMTKAVLKDFEVNKLDPTHEHYLKDGVAVNSLPKNWFGWTNKKELAKLQNEASLNNLTNKLRADDFDINETKLLNTDQLLLIRKNQFVPDSVYSSDANNTDKLPVYILRMAAEAGVNPYDLVNNQAKLNNIEDWVPMIPSPQTKVLLDNFKPSELATIYRMMPEGNINMNIPVKSLSHKLNVKLNKILTANGLTSLPNELAIFNAFENNSQSSWTTVGEGPNPTLGKFNILTTDVQNYFTRNNLNFNQKEFLEDHDLQRKVFKDLISRVSSETWTDIKERNVVPTFGPGGSLGPVPDIKNWRYTSNAKALRNIFHRITTGTYIEDYDYEGLDLQSIHQQNLFMQTFSQY